MRKASSRREGQRFSPPRRAAWLDKSDILIFLFGTVLFVGAVLYLVRRDYNTTLDLWKAQLFADVLHRTWTLRSSLQESEDDAQLLADFAPTRELLSDGIDGIKHSPSRATVQNQVLNLFDDFQKVYEYAALYLFDDEERVLLQATTDSKPWDTLIQTSEFKQIFESAKKERHYAVKLVRGPEQALALVIMMPVFADGKSSRAQTTRRSPVGMVAVLDPFAQELLPLLTTKNLHTRTGETVLLQLHDGAGRSALPSYVDGRGSSGQVSQFDTLRRGASLAVEDRAVFGQFVDYRGVEVLAAMQKISAIDGVVVFKVNNDEALSDLRGTARLEGSAAIAVILAYAGVILLFRSRAVAREMRGMLAREQLVNETLETTVAERTSQLAQINQQLSIELRERERAERETRELNAELELRVLDRTVELESANKELAAFAYSVSHDLRAPLRGIDGWSLALLEDCGSQLDASGQQYLNRVRSETQRMGDLIDGMLLLSRLARDEMSLNPVDLTAMAHSIATILRDSHPQRSMEFVIAPNLVTEGDARLLDIALTNLLSNAVKFTSQRNLALIEFGRIEQEGETTFYVRDNGAGFDMKHSGILFGAFQRLHKDSEFPGTGIGLAIVQRVVARHGGRVWAEASVNHGATFWFTLGVAHEFA